MKINLVGTGIGICIIRCRIVVKEYAVSSQKIPPKATQIKSISSSGIIGNIFISKMDKRFLEINFIFGSEVSSISGKEYALTSKG